MNLQRLTLKKTCSHEQKSFAPLALLRTRQARNNVENYHLQFLLILNVVLGGEGEE